ncbi:hypothetical protein RhiJN_10233 [Ceratobasidium sp. AG-Ba]|nr:hypothetical protein RhiJN_10233 [Ceratobasidium sp. AG-Ba]QRW10987.1 hypothetical protein RhiLY_09986 [Ceratobasidium sp. AG-Ba]
MPLIFHNYDPLECSCSSTSSELYCAYCNIVCDHALFDFEADIGQWIFFGRSDFSVSEEARCWVALDQLFRDERPITPPPVLPRTPSPDPFQALLDNPAEVDVLWSVPRPRFVRPPVFAVPKGKKPYDRPVSRKRRRW